MLNHSASLVVMSTSVLKALPGKLDIKRHLVFSIYRNPEPNNFNNSVLHVAMKHRIKFHLNLTYGSEGDAEIVHLLTWSSLQYEPRSDCSL